MFCLTDILGMYTINLPDPLKRLLLEYLKVDEGVLGQVLNHALQTVTRKHYAASNSVDDKRTALLKWDRYLSGLVVLRN